MSGATSISWTDATWNPVRGCSRVSAGCVNCYAETMAARFSDEGQAFHGFADRSRSGSKWTGKLALVTEHLADPLRWKKPRRIFVNSMSDLFHEKLSNEDIAAVFAVMAAAPQHTFQVLTKRARRMRAWFEWAASTWPKLEPMHATVPPDSNIVLAHLPKGAPFDKWLHDHGDSFAAPWPLPNVWLGVSVEDQRAADERIPDLLATPAAVRFLSCEPLIGEVDLDPPLCDDFDRHGDAGYYIADDEATPWCSECDSERSYGHWLRCDDGIDWVIAGCESGTGARTCEVNWLRSLRDQCAAASVPFFLKQAEGVAAVGGPLVTLGAGAREKGRGPRDRIIELPYLDGAQHAAFPTVPA